MYPQVTTIGVYGSDESSFFNALARAGVDVFCDVRLRRGMRGSLYSFVNSEKLQARLRIMGIRYLHAKELAPSKNIRALQKNSDDETGDTKRTRSTLSESFVSAYKEECLSGFNSKQFLERACENAHKIVFFCVERDPSACHRSIITEQLEKDLGITTEHIKP